MYCNRRNISGISKSILEIKPTKAIFLKPKFALKHYNERIEKLWHLLL